MLVTILTDTSKDKTPVDAFTTYFYLLIVSLISWVLLSLVHVCEREKYKQKKQAFTT